MERCVVWRVSTEHSLEPEHTLRYYSLHSANCFALGLTDVSDVSLETQETVDRRDSLNTRLCLTAA